MKSPTLSQGFLLVVLMGMFLFFASSSLSAQAQIPSMASPVPDSVPAETPGQSTQTDAAAVEEPHDPLVAAPLTSDPVVPVQMKVLYDFGFEVVVSELPGMKIYPGDYLEALPSDDSTRPVQLVVKDVRDQRIFARVLGVASQIGLGNSVRKVDRLPFDLDISYSGILVLGEVEDDSGTAYLAVTDYFMASGVRLAWVTGLYGFRPSVNVQVPFGSYVSGEMPMAASALPLMLGGGVEYSYYIGPITLQPQFNFDALLFLPPADGASAYAGLCINALARVSLDLDRFFSIFIQGGYERYYGDSLGSFGAVHAALGVSIR